LSRFVLNWFLIIDSKYLILKLMPSLSRTDDKKHLTFDKIKSIVSGHPFDKLRMTLSLPKGQLSVVRKTKGFTLIELLVVIAIIGILIAAATVSYTKAQQKGRDGKRKADLASIQQALELYFQTNGKYPQMEWVYANNGGTWVTGLNTNYIAQLPQDPIRQTDTADCIPATSGCYDYAYYSGGWCSINGKNYILTTRLEAYSGTDFSQRNIPGTACTWNTSAVSGLYVVTGP